MKILSLNLHCFKETNRIKKLDKISDFIKDNDIDVCLFQEAAQEISEKVIIDNIKNGNNAYYIAKKLGYNIIFHPIKIGFITLEEGLAIISKHPINDVLFKTISNTHDFNTWHKRDYLKASINGYIFYNVHLGWDIADEIGMNQINRLLEDVNKETKTLFLCGDFNYADDSNEIKYIKKQYYSISDLANLNSLDNPTFHFSLDNTKEANNKMIDFIFTNNKINIKEFKIVFNEEKDYVSDHNGLYLDL
jgi:maltose 6'-phosphate phosphatase